MILNKVQFIDLSLNLKISHKKNEGFNNINNFINKKNIYLKNDPSYLN